MTDRIETHRDNRITTLAAEVKRSLNRVGETDTPINSEMRMTDQSLINAPHDSPTDLELDILHDIDSTSLLISTELFTERITQKMK